MLGNTWGVKLDRDSHLDLSFKLSSLIDLLKANRKMGNELGLIRKEPAMIDMRILVK